VPAPVLITAGALQSTVRLQRHRTAEARSPASL